MRIGDLLKSYADLLPEPSKRHAEIIRLAAPDFRPEVVSFNLADALAGKPESNLQLQPFDTLRVFGRYDFEDPPTVTVSGEVRDPGEHRSNGDMRVRDAIYLAKGTTPDALLDDAQVFRNIGGGKVKVLSVNLGKALNGDPAENILLTSKDRLIVHRNVSKLEPARVYIQGEVANPGMYPLGSEMTASQLVRVAGGFKRSADTRKADLTNALGKNGSELREVEIASAMASADADVILREGDTLTIRQIPGWRDLGAAIAVRGEVVHPSTYGIREGERLSSILKRAGGFRASAYPQGAVLERVQIREVEEREREELIKRLDEEQRSVKISPNAAPAEEMALRQSFWRQQAAILSTLKSTPAVGRLVIKISPDIASWESSSADVDVRAGDVITIPKPPNFVMVTGQVYNANAISFRPGRNARWYLRQAGGATELGNKKGIFVVRADGAVVGNGGGTGWWSQDPLNVTLHPGDMVVVPEKLVGNSTSLFKGFTDSAQVFSSIAIAASVLLK
jgi:protein involved in polysaccharide export with SLBB domain